jgi:hypothetical protein
VARPYLEKEKRRGRRRRKRRRIGKLQNGRC